MQETVGFREAEFTLFAAHASSKAANSSKNLQGSLPGAGPNRVKPLGLIPGNARDPRDAIRVGCLKERRGSVRSFDTFSKSMQQLENAPPEQAAPGRKLSELWRWRLVGQGFDTFTKVCRALKASGLGQSAVRLGSGCGGDKWLVWFF